MLVITRKQNEGIRIGDQITITILDIVENRVKLGIDAPKEMLIIRNELHDAQTINQEATKGVDKELVDQIIAALKQK